GGARLLPVGTADLVFALCMLGPALEESRLVRLREIDRIARMRKGRGDRAAGLQHRSDAFVVEMIGVKNQIDTGARGVERRLAAAGMRHRLLAEAVDLANHDLRLFLSEGRDQLAVVAPLDAVERDFDAIDTVLDLTADLLDRLSDGSHQLAD